MLAFVTVGGARLDAASVGLGIARTWAEAGRRVLFVDADVEGSALARRLGEVTRAEYLPAERGLPSLIAARRPLTMKLLADHCYSLDTAGGSLWSLFAPFHARGGAHAAGWLAERASDVLELGRERAVLVASGGLRRGSPLLPLVAQSRAVAFLAPVRTPEHATALGEFCESAGMADHRRQRLLLVIEGSCSMTDKTIRAASGLRVLGRLPALEDERVLRHQGGRRERAFAGEIESLAKGLLSHLDLEPVGGAHAADDGSRRREPVAAAAGPDAAGGSIPVDGGGAAVAAPAPPAVPERAVARGVA